MTDRIDGERDVKASLTPYRPMKDSGEVWLGRVPAHWDVRRMRTLVRERVEKGHPHEPLLAATQTKGVVRKEEYENRTVLATKDLHLLKLVHIDDFVISLRSFQGGIEYAREKGIISPAYTVLHATNPDGQPFLAWLFKSQPFIENLSIHVTGIRQGQNVDYESLSRSRLPQPPPAEQAAIVRYLRHVDRRMSSYIRAKLKLIDLLNEQTQAVIRRALSRRFDTHASLKPSGIPWLGDVPPNWAVWQVGQFSRVGNGSTPSRGNPSYWSGGSYPWLNSSCANQESVTQADQFVTDVALRECHLPIVHPSSVLVAITGQGKTRGKATVLRIESTINQHLVFISPRPSVASAEFVHLALKGAYAHLRSISDDSGSTKGALTCHDLRHLRLAVPPVDEQERIVEAVSSDTEILRAGVESARKAIALIREYRTRLVADVVTGKLDVLAMAAALQAEGEAIEDEAVVDDLSLGVELEDEETGMPEVAE